MKNKTTAVQLRILCAAAVLMGLNIAASSFGIPVPGGHFYLNDVIICTAALLLPAWYSFAVGGIGAFLGDVFFYPTPMWVSLATHGLQALAITLIVRSPFGKKHPFAASWIGVSVGAVIMVVGYSLGRAFIYSTPEYAVMKLPYQILQAVVGAVLGVLLVHKFGVGKAYRKIILGEK